MRRMSKVVKLMPAKASWPNISRLAREHGIARSTVRERLAKGWRPEAAPSVPLEPTAEKMAPIKDSPPATVAMVAGRPSVSVPRLVGAAILAIAAVGIAGLALAINAQYGASIGETALA